MTPRFHYTIANSLSPWLPLYRLRSSLCFVHVLFSPTKASKSLPFLDFSWFYCIMASTLVCCLICLGFSPPYYGGFQNRSCHPVPQLPFSLLESWQRPCLIHLCVLTGRTHWLFTQPPFINLAFEKHSRPVMSFYINFWVKDFVSISWREYTHSFTVTRLTESFQPRVHVPQGSLDIFIFIILSYFNEETRWSECLMLMTTMQFN